MPPVCAFSVFLLHFDTMLYETLFSPPTWIVVLLFGVLFVCLFFPSPTLFESEYVSLAARTPFSPPLPPLTCHCSDILTFPEKSQKEPVRVPPESPGSVSYTSVLPTSQTRPRGSVQKMELRSASCPVHIVVK